LHLRNTATQLDDARLWRQVYMGKKLLVLNATGTV
jgi:hypothetical protein